MASDLAKIINGTATVTPAQRIELGLNVRKLPSPRPAPGTPGNFKVTLRDDGSLDLAWTCSNPRGSSGTIYQVFRRATPDGEFTYLGGTGDKKYLDDAIPAGASSMTYQIQAIRSTVAGPWAQFNVSFGTPVSAGGAMTASVDETPKSPKLAA